MGTTGGANAQSRLKLDPAEQAHLVAKGAVTMCVDPDWMPYEKIDASGRHVGIVADFMDAFQSMIGAPIKLVPTKSWSESLERAKGRDCDILSLLNESPERRNFLNFTRPYLTASVVLVARDDVFYLAGLPALGDRTLGIVKGYVYEEIIRRDYPDVKIVHVASAADALKKVSSGEICATIGSVFTLSRNLQELGLVNLKIAGQTSLTNEFRVGVRKDDPVLLDVFEKAVAGLPSARRNEILRRWHTVEFQHRFDWRLMAQIFAVAGLVVAVLGYLILHSRRLNRKLRQEVEEREEVEQYVDEARRVAEGANRAKSDFLSSMSHELRTPLNVVIGFSEYVVDDLDDPISAEQRACMTQVLMAGRHLLTLIDDVLDLSKVETGDVFLLPEVIDVAQVVDECVSLTKSLAAARNISLNDRVAGATLPAVKVDRTRYKQILLNLISNAVKYNRENGSIHIEREHSSGDRVRVGVRDTGAGIAPDDLDKLFDPFDRMGAENSDIEGTGIGLTITKRLVEQMGGEISVESEVGQGTVFWVGFPATDDAIVDSAAQSPGDGERDVELSGLILYIEDNLANLELVHKILGRHRDVTLIDATTAEMGIERARIEGPDAILMDIYLPGMDGFEALIELGNGPETRHIPVIALTAAATNEDIKKGRAAGFYEYLTKPIQARLLVDTLKRALSPMDGILDDGTPLRNDGTVIVIDDMQANLAVAERQLEKLSIACETVSDPVAGLEALKTHSYAFALVDVSMPGITGLQLTEELRAFEASEGRPHTPVIAMTASHCSENQMKRFRSAGMDGYLSKPAKLDDLAVLLNRWLSWAAEPETAGNSESTTNESDALPPIDLTQMAEILGRDDKELFQEIFDMFIERFPALIERLSQAVSTNDVRETHNAAHAAKSISANSAARRMVSILQKIETEAAQEDWVSMSAELASVRKEFDRVIAFHDEFKHRF